MIDPKNDDPFAEEEMADELLKDDEVAAWLKIGKSTVWKYAGEGKLPKPIKIGSLARWSRLGIKRKLATSSGSV